MRAPANPAAANSSAAPSRMRARLPPTTVESLCTAGANGAHPNQKVVGWSTDPWYCKFTGAHVRTIALVVMLGFVGCGTLSSSSSSNASGDNKTQIDVPVGSQPPPEKAEGSRP